jgi:hypothetical protein
LTGRGAKKAHLPATNTLYVDKVSTTYALLVPILSNTRATHPSWLKVMNSIKKMALFTDGN